jgi:hypothetical protein
MRGPTRICTVQLQLILRWSSASATKDAPVDAHGTLLRLHHAKLRVSVDPDVAAPIAY